MLKDFKLSEEDEQEFCKVVDSYKKYGDVVDEFIKKVPFILEKYKNDLLIDDITLLKGGRLGLIFSGYSKKYNKELVLKIIPSFLKVFNIEANAYKKLPNEYMCPVYKIDDTNNVIVMEKLNNKETLNFSKSKEETEKFFNTVFSNLILGEADEPMSYFGILNRYFDEIGNVDIDEWEDLKKSVLDRYEKYFKNDQLYLIHGDLHSNNIMKNNDGYRAIDPLGYASPKEFMFARFIITELFFTDCSQEYFEELIDFISKYSDKERLLNAVYIDSMLFLSALLLQIENYSKALPKVMDIINLISRNINDMEENVNEKNSYNITKTRKLIFGC